MKAQDARCVTTARGLQAQNDGAGMERMNGHVVRWYSVSDCGFGFGYTRRYPQLALISLVTYART